MSNKSLLDMNEELKNRYNTRTQTYNDFPVGTHVQIICVCQDFNFFYSEEGVVEANSGKYLGIRVVFDKPRKFEDGSVQTYFNFDPDDLIPTTLRRIRLKEEKVNVNET
jgi:hypothetical protein